MEVTSELIEKLAQLAKLEFDDDAKKEIINDLRKIISFVEKLKEMDTKGVEPLIHVSGELNKLREDEVKLEIERDEALQNAPFHDEKFFKVPKVIKKD